MELRTPIDLVGLDLAAYICATTPADVRAHLDGDSPLEHRQAEALSTLLATVQSILERNSSSLPTSWILAFLCEGPQGSTVAARLRELAGGEVRPPSSAAPVAGPLLALLGDVYPLLLAPRDPHGPGLGPLFSAAVTYKHPVRTQFEADVLADEVLSKLVAEERQDSGGLGMAYSSIGVGESIQLALLSDRLITAGWWRSRLANDMSLATIADNTLENLDLVRRAVRGDEFEVPAIVGLAGAVPDGEVHAALPFGHLEPVSEQERVLEPSMLEGNVGFTNAAGVSTIGSYAGDLILRTSVPYRLEITPLPANDDVPRPWPDHLRGYDVLEEHLNTIRVASLLDPATDGGGGVVPTWQIILNPLGEARYSWRDPRGDSSIQPRPFDQAALDELATWTTRIHEHRQPTIDVAIRRTISAATTRRDPADALVDIVIAWENLFGSRKGEPTLRIAAAVGWLLGEDHAAREQLRSSCARLYDLRSDVVHGNRIVPPHQAVEAWIEARSINRDVLRALFEHRHDLLRLKKGEDRSRKLLMGG